jgi:hypothetical protein
MIKSLVALSLVALSAAPAAAATWSIYVTLFPAANPSVGGPPYGEFRVVGPIGNYALAVNCINVRNQMVPPVGTDFNFMPFPSPTYGVAWPFCVQTSP